MIKFGRRETIRLLTGGAGALAAGHLLPHVAEAAEVSGPRRVIFFLQNHGLKITA